MLDNFTDGLLDILEAKMLRMHEDFEGDLFQKMKERQGQ
jgi:hypothetical protein